MNNNYQILRDAFKNSTLREEMTDRQYEICKMYFIDQQTMPDIARSLKLNKSTVSRAVKSGSKYLDPEIRNTRNIRHAFRCDL